MKPIREVYCDGSCLNNGKSGAKAGIGIYSPNGNISVSEPLKSHLKHTNQTAELSAVIKTLKLFPNDRLKIYTDSKYVINCATLWISTWKKTKWCKKGTNNPVSNQTLLKELSNLLDSRLHAPYFIHVKGHSGNVYNEKADRLAQAGARLAVSDSH